MAWGLCCWPVFSGTCVGAMSLLSPTVLGVPGSQALLFICPLGPGAVAGSCIRADILPTAGGLCH